MQSTTANGKEVFLAGFLPFFPADVTPFLWRKRERDRLSAFLVALRRELATCEHGARIRVSECGCETWKIYNGDDEQLFTCGDATQA